MGAKPVAAAGLLEGKEATTYPLDGGRHLQYLAEPGVEVVNREMVVSDRIITGAGPAASFAVAFKLLEMLSGREDVEKVKRAMRFAD